MRRRASKVPGSRPRPPLLARRGATARAPCGRYVRLVRDRHPPRACRAHPRRHLLRMSERHRRHRARGRVPHRGSCFAGQHHVRPRGHRASHGEGQLLRPRGFVRPRHARGARPRTRGRRRHRIGVARGSHRAVPPAEMQYTHRQDRGCRGAGPLAPSRARHRRPGRVHPADRAQRPCALTRPARVGEDRRVDQGPHRRRSAARSRVGERVARRHLPRGRGRRTACARGALRHRTVAHRGGDHRERLFGTPRSHRGRVRRAGRARLHRAHGRLRQRLLVAQHAEGHQRRRAEDRHALPRPRRPAQQGHHGIGHPHGALAGPARHRRRRGDARAGELPFGRGVLVRAGLLLRAPDGGGGVRGAADRRFESSARAMRSAGCAPSHPRFQGSAA